MKYFLLVSSAFIAISSVAQNNFMYPFNQYAINMQRQESEQWFKKLAPTKKVKCLSGISSIKKNEDNTTIYNENGEVIEREYTHRFSVLGFTSKEYVHKRFNYVNNQLSQINELDKKNKEVQKITYSYFAPKKVSKTEFFRKDKKVREEINTFNLDSTRSSYVIYKFKNNTPRLNLKYNYDFTEVKQLKQVRMYNHKNKLKYTWNYDCSPKGELVEKNSSKICKSTSINNKGQMVEVEFFTDDKNKQTKRITTYYFYNGKKVSVGMQNYIIKNGKEQLNIDWHIADSLEPYHNYKLFSKKGELLTESASYYSVYNSKEQRLKETVYKNYDKEKVVYLQSTVYNELGLPIESKTVKNETKQLSKGVFTYQGDSLYTINYYGKNPDKIKSTYTAKVVYY